MSARRTAVLTLPIGTVLSLALLAGMARADRTATFHFATADPAWSSSAATSPTVHYWSSTTSGFQYRLASVCDAVTTAGLSGAQHLTDEATESLDLPGCAGYRSSIRVERRMFASETTYTPMQTFANPDPSPSPTPSPIASPTVSSSPVWPLGCNASLGLYPSPSGSSAPSPAPTEVLCRVWSYPDVVIEATLEPQFMGEVALDQTQYRVAAMFGGVLVLLAGASFVYWQGRPYPIGRVTDL